MNKEEMRAKFEENVAYLKRNVPPDDIYMFTEQTLMAAMFFIYKWSDHVDLNEEADKDETARKWLSNILKFQEMKNTNQDIQLDLNLDSVDE